MAATHLRRAWGRERRSVPKYFPGEKKKQRKKNVVNWTCDSFVWARHSTHCSITAKYKGAQYLGHGVTYDTSKCGTVRCKSSVYHADLIYFFPPIQQNLHPICWGRQMTYGGYTSIQLLFSWTGMGEWGLQINNVYKTSTGYSTQLMRVRGEADRELATISVFQSFCFSLHFSLAPEDTK